MRVGETQPAHGHPPTAADVVAHLPFLREYLCIYYSGSHALGWNHARSDFDLYVITKTPVEIDRHAPDAVDVWGIDVDADPPKIGLFLGSFGPYRSDVEFWLESQIDHVLRRLPRTSAVTDDVINFPSADREFLSKLAAGRAIAGEAWLLDRQRLLGASQVHRAITVQGMLTATSLLEDTAGFIASDDVASALLAVTQAFDVTIDALLALHGDLTPQQKWTARRFRAVQPGGISFERYWTIQTRSTYRASNPREWIEDTARECHRLLTHLTVELND